MLRTARPHALTATFRVVADYATAIHRQVVRQCPHIRLRSVTALLLISALVLPTAVLARPLGNDVAGGVHAQLTAFNGLWPQFASFFGIAQGGAQRSMPPLPRPIPERRAILPPASRGERAARVTRLLSDLLERLPQGGLVLPAGLTVDLPILVPLDADGDAVHGLTVEWESSDPKVVLITPDGELTTQGVGSAQVTASAGSHKLAVPVRVVAAPPQGAAADDRQIARRHTRGDGEASFIPAGWSPQRSHRAAAAPHRLSPVAFHPVALVQSGGAQGPLPDAETASLYAPANQVGMPPGATEPGAVTPPAAFAGTETPLSANFMASVSLISLPGRNLDANLALTYNSRVWHRSTDSGGVTRMTYDVDSGWPAPGFRLGYGQLEAQGTSGYTLTGADGTRHQMVSVGADTFETTDGTFIRLVEASTAPAVYYPNGTRVRYGAANGPRLFPTRIRTSNGNVMLISYAGGVGPRISTVQDTLGRYIRFHYDATNNLVAITRPGYEGGADYQVARFYYEDVPLTGTFQLPTRAPASARMIRYLYFPGTGEGMRFSYTPYGQSQVIRHLRGMAISTLALTETGTVTGGGEQAAQTSYNYPTTASNLADAPTFTRRTDEWTGRTAGMNGTAEAPYHTFAVDQAQGTSTITAPDGSVAETKAIVAAGQWNDGLVNETTVRQGTTVLRQGNTVWEHDGTSRNHRPQRVSVTDDGANTRTTGFSYTSYNNVAVAREYDFNGTTELRRTEMTYETRAQYTDRRLIHLPTQVRLFEGGAGAPISRTDYDYDVPGASLTARADLIMHDPTYNPAIPANPDGTGYNPATDNRGNLTQVTRYAEAGSGGSPVTDTLSYDIAGNLVTQTADCCQQRSYTYTKAYEYAYPTSMARGNSGQLTTSATYDFNTGVTRSRTDENNQTSTHQYEAATLRHERTDEPSGGAYLVNLYEDNLVNDPDASRRHTYVYTHRQLEGTNLITNYAYFDGRGAPARSFANTEQGYATVDTEYDVMGRAYRSSNPYHSSGAAAAVNSAGLWTTQSYDGLGRGVQVRMPDNTTMGMAYAGTAMTTTDQAGRQRRQISDALGRVRRTDEPDSAGNLGAVASPTQATDYTYNAQDNLVRITQGAQTRFFKFDGLGRMTHQRMPEQDAPHSQTDALTGNNTWSQRMLYNTHSLVTDVYDARNVRTQLTYDGLNRSTQTTYSDGTPTVTRGYDEARSGAYNRGRLTSVTTAAAGSTPQTVEAYDYDRLGRVWSHRQTVGSTTYNVGYGYNNAGLLTSETYPSGRTVKYDYDNHGGLAAITDGAATPKVYANNIEWSAHGGLQTETFGNGATHMMSYNNRLQPTEIKLMMGGSERQRFTYAYGQVEASTGALDATKNTGQLGRTDSFISGAKQWEMRHTYNRLGQLDQSWETHGGTGAMVWRTDYSYDRYGNRFQNSALNTGVSYTAVNTSDINAGRNRFTSGVTYDAAGNITADTKFRHMQYSYDANNRLRWAARSDGTAPTTAVYDGGGQRVMTASSGGAQWRHTIRDIFGRIITEHVPGGWERDNIYRGAELIAVEEVGRTCYVLRDRLGSERVMMDASGTVMARHDYQPYGEELSAGTGMRTGGQGYGGADTVRQRYAGTERDEWTGLEHTEWRKLESAAGRWTSPDPYGGSMSTGDPQSMNRYTYVGNDPVNANDPSGLLLSSWDSFNAPWEGWHESGGGGGGGGGWGGGMFYTGGGSNGAPLLSGFNQISYVSGSNGDYNIVNTTLHVFSFGSGEGSSPEPVPSIEALINQAYEIALVKLQNPACSNYRNSKSNVKMIV